VRQRIGDALKRRFEKIRDSVDCAEFALIRLGHEKK
jgi:hypothetical protein